jgi:acetaldehyde dehydrogenase
MIGAAVLGSGNIGTDLMIKLLRATGPLRMTAMAGIDQIRVVFDATSAAAHLANAAALAPYDLRIVDLTPAALGPFVVPAVNLGAHRQSDHHPQPG